MSKERKGAPATYERRLWGEGYARLAGVDEVGRDLFGEITQTAVAWAVGVVESSRVDEINVLRATFEAMEQAVAELSPAPDFVLVDGRDVPRFPLPYQAVLQGDALVYSIAAASIVAKVWRDRIMVEMHQEWPAYGWDRNKGYGTKEHQAALREHGACPQHRTSYGPIKVLGQGTLGMEGE
jgi:ribonuclease HII